MEPKTAITTPAAITPFEPADMKQAIELSTMLSKSSLLPTPLKNRPEDVMVTILTGREIGLSPMQSLRGIHVIEGKGVTSAETMVALCLRRPEVCEYFQLVESSDAKATYETKRRGSPRPTRMTYTIEQAKQANLLGKKNWRENPAAMLRARCASALGRVVYPDLLNGIYDHDEGDEIKREGRAGSIDARADAATVVEGQVVQTAPKTAAKRPAAAKAAPMEDAEIFDEETGEVARPGTEGQGAPPEPATEHLVKAIADAASIDALKALVPQMNDVGDAAKGPLRAAYGERLKALKAAAGPASAAPPTDEPGSNG